ncbi:MAG: DUF4173 domain-containing protein [Flavobacteriales bacterium]|nr:DUF4173 domain-containing protein [Flavobacteriales bacterium]
MNMPVAIARSRFARWSVLLTITVPALLFDRLFWQQGMGVDILLFSVLIIGMHFIRFGWSSASVPSRVLAVGTFIASAMVVVHDSVAAILAAWSSLFLFAAMVQRPSLRSPMSGMGEWVMNVSRVPSSVLTALNEALEGRPSTASGWRWLRLSVLPVLALLIYVRIYRSANPRFDALTAGIFDRIGAWSTYLFDEVLTAHAFFLLLAIYLSAALLRRHTTPLIERWEAAHPDTLLRRRVRRLRWLAPSSMFPLERERQRGVLLLIGMNALLLVVNIVDIDWLWFGFTVPPDFSLKQFVHEGTWLLILSILLSMIILFHLFRGNQNFHPKAGSLRILALAWVAQNFLLGISVFLRNYHYIEFHGLAYKRIGVIVFLALVLVGLITLFRKIQRRWSVFHVLRVNAWAAYAMLLALSLVDWDGLIVRYNLDHWNPGQIDVDNYLRMSDKVLPQVYAGLPEIDAQIAKHRTNVVRWVHHLDPQVFREDLDRQRRAFLDRHAHKEWPSWNWADERTFQRLHEMGLDHDDR